MRCLLASGVGRTVSWLIVPMFGESSICCKEFSTNTAKRLGGCSLGMCHHVLSPTWKREIGQEPLVMLCTNITVDLRLKMCWGWLSLRHFSIRLLI